MWLLSSGMLSAMFHKLFELHACGTRFGGRVFFGRPQVRLAAFRLKSLFTVFPIGRIVVGRSAVWLHRLLRACRFSVEVLSSSQEHVNVWHGELL
jgi:hypothetical protein